MELFEANKQWAERPADERFWTLRDMIEKCMEYKRNAAQATVSWADLRVESHGDSDLYLTGKAGTPAKLTHWAFGQLCRKANAPAEYLRELPATLAINNLNHGLNKNSKQGNESARLLMHRNGGYVLRAATTDAYQRIWNADLLASLEKRVTNGWQVPPARPSRKADPRARPATEADCLTMSRQRSAIAIKPGDMIAPAGLYASDHDCFVFMVNEENPIDDGKGNGLSRGFFLWNSEVGASSFGITMFLYDAVCGNHIVWGAKVLGELRLRHVGDAPERALAGVTYQLHDYNQSATGKLTNAIAEMRKAKFEGETRDELVDSIYAYARKKKARLSNAIIEDAIDVVESTPRYGSPASPWGIVNGLTEVSQRTDYADRRVEIDREAGKLLTVDF